jgi:hypothetical protein
LRRSPIRSRRVAIASAASAVLLSGCGSESSYAATEKALQDWLAAIDSGDPAACALETSELHDELLAEHPKLGGRGTDCAERVKRMGTIDLPPADSTMEVPVWDPAGEALVSVSDSATGALRRFWMVFEDGRWLVAGEADQLPGPISSWPVPGAPARSRR